jgi:hypothetical protein
MPISWRTASLTNKSYARIFIGTYCPDPEKGACLFEALYQILHHPVQYFARY